MTEELISVPYRSVLKRFRNKAQMTLGRDDSISVRCRYPNYIDIINRVISAREGIRLSRIYPGLVHVGYGIKYNELKSKQDESLYMVGSAINALRASTNEGDNIFADGIENVIAFEGGIKKYRYPDEFIAENSGFAELCNVNVSDFFYFYYLVGLKHLIDETPRYDDLKQRAGYKLGIHGLTMAELRIKATIGLIDGYLVIR